MTGQGHAESRAGLCTSVYCLEEKKRVRTTCVKVGARCSLDGKAINQAYLSVFITQNQFTQVHMGHAHGEKSLQAMCVVTSKQATSVWGRCTV